VTIRASAGIVRLVLAATCVVALIARYFWGLGSAVGSPTNFFAYLTIQSNIGFAVVSTVGGIVALRRDSDPHWLTTVRATVLSCTVAAGIVYAFLVQQAGQRGFRIDVPWSDQLLHFVIPPLAVLEWYLASGRGRAPWRCVVFVVVYTLGWGASTLVRGAIVGWYPYFFLDPAQVSWPFEFLGYCAIALGVLAGIAAGVVAMTRAPMTRMREARRPRISRPRTERDSRARRR
jgi:hypothetical protein